MSKLYVFERDRISGLTEGEHSAPILTEAARTAIPISVQFPTTAYFYRGAEGQIAGPGLFMRTPPQFWPDEQTPLFVMIDPDLDY